MHKIISDYLDEVCAQIRNRGLRTAVRTELTAHLLERCAELEKGGDGGEDSARRAITQMGNPHELGRQLVTAGRSPRDIAALLCGSALAVLALLMTIAMSSGLSLFIDFPSIALGLVLPSAFALISAGRGLTFPKFLHQFKTGSLLSGVLLTVIGLIAMLSDVEATEALGFNLSVALLGLFYGLLFAAIAHAAERWCQPSIDWEKIGLVKMTTK